MSYSSTIFSIFKTYIAAALIIVILAFSASIAFTPMPVRAAVPTWCMPALDVNCQKEIGWDLVAHIIASTILQVMTQTIVAWISGNGGQNVGFVENFERVISQQVDARAGEFLNHLAGINLCSVSLRNYLTLRFSMPIASYRYLNPRLSCTLSGIVNNVENFYNSFQNGGWAAFLSVNLQMQNNYYGAYMLALESQSGLLAEAANAVNQNIQANQGYRGVQIPIPSKKCEWIPDINDYSCYTEWETKTPGGLVKDSLSKALVDTGLDQIVAADELEEAVSAIINAAVQRLLTAVFF